MPATNDVYIPPTLQLRKIDIWDSENKLDKIDTHSKNAIPKASAQVQSSSLSKHYGKTFPITQTMKSNTGSKSKLINCESNFGDDLERRRSISITGRLSDERRSSQEMCLSVKLQPRISHSKLLVDSDLSASKEQRSIRESRFSSSRQTIKENLSLLVQLQQFSTSTLPTKNYQEIFGWDDMTFEIMSLQILSGEIVMTPFGRALELMLKYFDPLFLKPK